MKTRKVITSARLKTAESVVQLNVDNKNRAVLVGKRSQVSDSGVGLVGKIAEQGIGSSVLDYGVWLDLTFPHVIGIFGTRGSGKSFDLGVLAECILGLQEVVQGKTPTSSLVLFDVQDQFWTLGLAPNPELQEDKFQLEQLEQWGLVGRALPAVTVWCPAGYKTLLKETKPLRLSPKQLTSDDWLTLLDLERYSPMGQALLILLRDFGPAVPGALATRSIASAGLGNFQQATLDGLRWRLSALSETSIIDESGIEIEEFLQPGTVSIVFLRQVPDSLRALIVGVICRLASDRMGSFHQARRIARRTGKSLSQERLPDRFWMFVDEAHVIVPAGAKSAATQPIIDYVKRGRDAGLSMAFATQQPSAVDTRLMSQVDITLTHGLGFESDLLAAVARMPTRNSLTYEQGTWKLTSMNEVIRSLDPGECVVADAANGRSFIAKVRPRLTAHGGNTPV
jgi:uncharacterized protein DUF87